MERGEIGQLMTPGGRAVDRSSRPGFRWLHWLTTLLPLAFLVVFDQLRHAYFSEFWHHWPGSAVATALVAAAMLLFSSVVFTVIGRMEREILSRSEQLHAQTQRLAVLEERERIGMDLHDGAIQSLYAVGLALEDCAGQLEREPAQVRRRLGQAIDSLNGIIRDIRNYIFDLRPQALDGCDLRQSLANLVEELKINALADTTLSIAGDLDGRLSPEKALQVLHIAREALANILKHARASAVQVRLAAADGRLLLSVRDNGTGFDPARAGGEEHHGLRNMQERALALGGTLHIQSARGQGTTVEMEIPLNRAERAA